MEDLESKYGEIIWKLCDGNQEKGKASEVIGGVRYMVDFYYDRSGGLEGFYADEYSGTLFVDNEAYYFTMKDVFCSEGSLEVERDEEADLRPEDFDYWRPVVWESDADLRSRVQKSCSGMQSVDPVTAKGQDLGTLAYLVGLERKSLEVEQTTNLNKQEENIMTTNTIATVYLMDNDTNLGETGANNIVAKFEDVVITPNEPAEQTLLKLAVNRDIKGRLAAHNAKRATVNNPRTLNQTGKKVPLQPITISDVDVIIK